MNENAFGSGGDVYKRIARADVAISEMKTGKVVPYYRRAGVRYRRDFIPEQFTISGECAYVAVASIKEISRLGLCSGVRRERIRRWRGRINQTM